MKTILLSLIFAFPLLSHANDSITVYLFLAEDCPICRYYTLDLKQMYEEYGKENIGFIGLFPNRSSTERKISEFRDKYKINFPLKREYFQKTAKDFGVTVTPEVVVYNEKTKTVLYQGRIDDTYASLGRKRPKPTQTELQDVLSNLSTNNPISVERTVPVGCFITFMD